MGLHIDNVDLGGGDPLAIVEAALRQIRDRENKRDSYEARAVLLDTDKLGRSPERDRQAQQLLADESILAIWQTPCHEALLLRHLPGCASLRPATTKGALERLRAHWPDYARPMAALRLAERLTYESVCQAAAVEPQLRAFIGILKL